MVKTARQIKAAQFRKTRKKWGQVKGIKPERDAGFLQYLRFFPCLICWRDVWESDEVWELHRVGWQPAANRGPVASVQSSATEAAHIGDTGKGMSAKCSDFEAVPLCGLEHHREGPESIHKLGRKEFEKRHGVDLLAIAAELRKRYLAEAA